MNGRKSAAGTPGLFAEILPNGGSECSNALTDVKRPDPVVVPLGVEQIGPGDNIGCFGFASARFERLGCVGFNGECRTIHRQAPFTGTRKENNFPIVEPVGGQRLSSLRIGQEAALRDGKETTVERACRPNPT